MEYDGSRHNHYNLAKCIQEIKSEINRIRKINYALLLDATKNKRKEKKFLKNHEIAEVVYKN